MYDQDPEWEKTTICREGHKRGKYVFCYRLPLHCLLLSKQLFPACPALLAGIFSDYFQCSPLFLRVDTDSRSEAGRDPENNTLFKGKELELERFHNSLTLSLGFSTTLIKIFKVTQRW